MWTKKLSGQLNQGHVIRNKT